MIKHRIVAGLFFGAVLFQFQYPAVFGAALRVCFCFLICCGAVASLHNYRRLHITVAAVTVTIGVAVMVTGAQTLQGARGSSAWPSVTGEVSVLETATGGAGVYGIEHEFEYRYSVHGRDYVNNRVSWDPVHWDAAKKSALMQQYQQNSEVTVYYNPAHPRQSILSPGFGWLALMRLCFGVAIASAGFCAGFLPLL